eukprot:jgi/Mesvir1/27079/Mv20770-RA.1
MDAVAAQSCASSLAFARGVSAPAARPVNPMAAAKCTNMTRSGFMGARVSLSSGIAETKSRESFAVYAGKGKGGGKRANIGQRQMPPMPNLDVNDPNPQYVLFVRSKNGPLWYPMSILNGGSIQKMFTQAMKVEWTKGLYEGAIKKQIGAAIYKDEDALYQAVRQKMPVLKTAAEKKELEFGFKLIDVANVATSFKPVGIEKIPPKEEVMGIVDKALAFFNQGKKEEEKKKEEKK